MLRFMLQFKNVKTYCLEIRALGRKPRAFLNYDSG